MPMTATYIYKKKVRSLVPPALLAALAKTGTGGTIAFVDSSYPVARWSLSPRKIVIINLQQYYSWLQNRDDISTRDALEGPDKRGECFFSLFIHIQLWWHHHVNLYIFLHRWWTCGNCIMTTLWQCWPMLRVRSSIIDLWCQILASHAILEHWTSK